MTVLPATIGPSAYWYLARGTGAVSLLLLTASVVLGVLGPLRFSAGRWPRFALDTLHRDVSLLVIVVLVVHIVTSVLDSFAPIAVTDAVIPLAGTYRPLWLGLGALSFDLLVALVITSLVRRRLGYRRWRAIHWLAYASWPVAVLHGLGSGSDTRLWWMLVLTAACGGAVAAAVWLRIARAAPERAGVRGPALLLSVLTPVGLVMFTLAGPLQPGWARRAGTPTRLLATGLPPAAVVRRIPGTPSTATRLSAFTATLAGRLRQIAEPGGAVVDISLRLGGRRRGRLRVRLAGSPIPGGGLSMTGSQVDLIASGLPSVLAGQIESLQGTAFVARVRDASGAALDVHARLRIDNQTGAVTGSLRAAPSGSRG